MAQFLVPRQYEAFAMVNGDVTVFETVAKYEWMPRRLGQRWGQRSSSNSPLSGPGCRSLLKSAEEVKAGHHLTSNPDLYSLPVIGTLVLLPFLLLLIDLVRPRRRAAPAEPGRRDRWLNGITRLCGCLTCREPI